ncbi:MAG: tRNA (guanine37-N1)-methyltransferase [Actinomycetota bacterium]|nr:tRNA (guanine37-N1)-methyltransferase [Actinomycetota bacterium]
MRIDVVTIFPEYLAPLDLSLIGRARRAGLLDLAVHDLRDFTHDRHRTVDDTPAGGGAGMVMRPEPWDEALGAVVRAGRAAQRAAGQAGDPEAGEPEAGEPEAGEPEAGEPEAGDVPVLIVPTPSGEVLTQRTVVELGDSPWLAFACGRYEGMDQRVLTAAAHRMPVREISLGDYVLNGGEVAVLAVVEAVARLLPGVLGNAGSLVEESHEDGLLEYPVYTKPASWNGLDVPEVLLSGHHGQVARWRRDQRLVRTARRRPDLLARLDPEHLDRADLAVLRAEGWEPASRGFQRTGTPVAD